MTKDYLPSGEPGLIEWSNEYFPYLKLHAKDWNVDETKSDALATTFNTYLSAYQTYHRPETHTPANRLLKDSAKKTYVKALRGFNQAWLIHNELLTVGDRRSLGLTIPDPEPSPSPDPPTYPVITRFISRGAGWTEMHFRDVTSEKSSAKPFGVHCAEIKWGLFAVGEPRPTSANELPNSAVATRSPYTFKFEGPDRRKELCVVLRWENTRGVKGPWGPDIESTIIE